jgi:tetratricopeptide (TPR) repeat protein
VEQGKLAEAAASYRRAIEFATIPALLAQAYNNLGNVLKDQGDPTGAAAYIRKAIEINPKLPQAHLSLGNVLRNQGDWSGAAACYRKALEVAPNYAEAHCNLGQVLAQEGEFALSLKAYQTGHELGTRSRKWPYPSEQWVRQAKRKVELDSRLPDLLSGQRKPAGAAECIELGDLCRCKKLYAAAVRFYTEAFAMDGKLAEDMKAQHRYDAACLAALAGCGLGKDTADLDEEKAKRHRRQALTWLCADLEAWTRRLDQDSGKAHPFVAKTMQHWLDDTDFAGVRGPEALFRIPEGERQEWQKLWVHVAALRERTAKASKTRNSRSP